MPICAGILATVVVCGCVQASEVEMLMVTKDIGKSILSGRTEADSNYVWYDAKRFGVEGRGWCDTEGDYGRIPRKAKDAVREVIWELGKQSAGLSVRFVTDSNTIVARWKLKNRELSMPHMSAVGASGLDLYLCDGGRWRNVGIGIPTKFPVNEHVILRDKRAGIFEYALYLPLWNGVESLEIGVEPIAKVYKYPISLTYQKPIVFYGSSIVQGACASRPGMTYSSILGRRLNRPIINLGFSGNAKIEPKMADLLSELSPAVYVIDPVPNISGDEIKSRFESFIKKIRTAHADTPIVICETICEPNADYIPWLEKRVHEQNETLRAICDKFTSQGIKNIYYVERTSLIGSDGEAFADLGHPTDLGFMRMADALEPILKTALQSGGGS